MSIVSHCLAAPIGDTGLTLGHFSDLLWIVFFLVVGLVALWWEQR